MCKIVKALLFSSRRGWPVVISLAVLSRTLATLQEHLPTKLFLMVTKLYGGHVRPKKREKRCWDIVTQFI